jgi:YfiH family protein
MWFEPEWPKLSGVRALSTERLGGVSAEPYQSLNLGTHVGDKPQAVQSNRDRLIADALLPASPIWLDQVHGTKVLRLPCTTNGYTADASYTRSRQQLCAVLTADCLPILLRSKLGDEVAAAHAGWRGLAAGVVEATVAEFDCASDQIQAWLGPAIGPAAFEVGREVVEAFVTQDNDASKAFVTFGKKYLADMYHLARLKLSRLGVTAVFGGHFCTVNQSERFFSYRRERVTGRQASLIWLE